MNCLILRPGMYDSRQLQELKPEVVTPWLLEGRAVLVPTTNKNFNGEGSTYGRLQLGEGKYKELRDHHLEVKLRMVGAESLK